MRSALLAASVCLLTAGVAVAQTPQTPAPETIPVPGGTPPELAPPPPNGLVNDNRPFDMTGPRVWASADYLLMWYTPMRSPPLIQAIPSGLVNTTIPGATVFPERNRIDFGAFSGIRANVGVNWQKMGVDVGGFVLQRQTERGSLFTNGTPVAVAQGYVAAGSGAPTSLLSSFPGRYSGGVNVIADSRLWGAEGNFRCAWFSFLADTTDGLLGFKYLDLQESLLIDAPSTFPNGSMVNVHDSIRTRNNFYGGYVGFNSRIGGWERGFGIDLTSKSAVGGVAQRAELFGSNSFISPTGVADTEAGGLYARGANSGTFTRSKIAYLHDLDVKLTYNFNPWIQVSFGYSLIYLSSVMRPGKAIDPIVNDSNVRFVADPTPSNLNRPAFSWRAEEFVVQGMTFGVRVQY